MYMDKNITTYIREQINAGQPKENIFAELIKAGWSEEVIEAHFSDINQVQPVKDNKIVEKLIKYLSLSLVPIFITGTFFITVFRAEELLSLFAFLISYGPLFAFLISYGPFLAISLLLCIPAYLFIKTQKTWRRIILTVALAVVSLATFILSLFLFFYALFISQRFSFLQFIPSLLLLTSFIFLIKSINILHSENMDTWLDIKKDPKVNYYWGKLIPTINNITLFGAIISTFTYNAYFLYHEYTNPTNHTGALWFGPTEYLAAWIVIIIMIIVFGCIANYTENIKLKSKYYNLPHSIYTKKIATLCIVRNSIFLLFFIAPLEIQLVIFAVTVLMPFLFVLVIGALFIYMARFSFLLKKQKEDTT